MTEHNSVRRSKDQEQEDLADEAKDCRRHGYILTGKFLGQGAYAKVYLGQALPEKVQNNYKLKKASFQNKSMKVAIKIISTVSAPEIYITKFLPREVSTMNRCYRHENVIQLYDLFATQKRIYLVLEYAECGDLLTYVNRCYSKRSSEEPLTEEKARQLFHDIIAGISFIHDRGVAHRDLKCENILLAKNRQAKLSDFGFAIEPRQNRELLRTHCGSYAYAPPEILKQQRYDGKLADLWSLGVILFAMVNGGLPFKESDAKAVLAAMKKPVYFKGCLTAECKDLIRGLLKIRPQKRLSLQEVFNHAWMRKCWSNEGIDFRAGGDEEREIGDIPLIRGRTKDWKFNGQFLTAESVLKYIRERTGIRSSLYKRPELRQIEGFGKEEEVSANAPILTSVHLTPQLPKESVPATPMFSASQPQKTQSRPKPAIEVLQKTSYSTPTSKGVVKTYMKYHTIDTNQSSKLPPPTKLEAINSQTNAEADGSAEKADQRLEGVEKGKCKTTQDEINKPTTKRYSISRNENNWKSRKSQTSAEKPARTRRSTTPNVININIASNTSASNRTTTDRPLSRKTQMDLQALQRISIYNAHAHRKIRCGAISVPPESRPPPPTPSKPERYNPRKSPQQVQRSNAICVVNKMSKTKSDNCPASEKKPTDVGPDEFLKRIKNISNKLTTIPEGEGGAQKKRKPSNKVENEMSHQHSSDVGDRKQPGRGSFEKASPNRGKGECPQNTKSPVDQNRRFATPATDKMGCAMAAWVGKHGNVSPERKFTDTLSSSTAQFLASNQFYYKKFTDSLYNPHIQRSRNAEDKPPEPGKLLYKRAQANKNTLGNFTQSMRATPHPVFRRARSPMPRFKDPTKPLLQGSYSPPPVLRFTHKMNKYK